MSARVPVTTVAELATLDGAEIVEGYLDGLRNEPAPGDNRSKAYWHGWRNGMVDGRHREPDEAGIALVKDCKRVGYGIFQPPQNFTASTIKATASQTGQGGNLLGMGGEASHRG